MKSPTNVIGSKIDGSKKLILTLASLCNPRHSGPEEFLSTQISLMRHDVSEFHVSFPSNSESDSEVPPTFSGMALNVRPKSSFRAEGSKNNCPRMTR